MTGYPSFFLQGKSVPPSVFPVNAIRRHVHMYHVCPSRDQTGNGTGTHSATGDAEQDSGIEDWVCGLAHEEGRTGGRKVWRHKYMLAGTIGTRMRRDRYILNEHWHGTFRDGIE